jgi:eukaryotic-like serine/threonine-protein kinase
MNQGTRACLIIAAACGRVGFHPAVDRDALATGDGVADSTVDEAEIVIPAGPFMMGCNPALDDQCRTNELPYHMVTLSSFAIDRTEITQAAYAQCVAGGSCTQPSDQYDPANKPQHPVAFVTWDQAVAYCGFVGKRLPTEAEWEKAARGDDGRTYVWGEEVPTCDHAAFAPCAGNESKPVGSYPLGASAYGLMDMCGNLWEWIADWSDNDYYAISPASDPTGPATGSSRVVRGGYFANIGQILRAAYRSALDPSTADRYLGFRCARSL